MSSDSDTLSYFTPLDELIQVIYQGSARFVIISSVDDASWTVHVGLTGTEGRWWRGRWTEKDVKNTVVRAASSHRKGLPTTSIIGIGIEGFVLPPRAICGEDCRHIHQRRNLHRRLELC